MAADRKVAVAVGTLFVIAMVAGLSQFAFRGALNFPDYLTEIAAAGNSIATAAVLDLIMIGAIFSYPGGHLPDREQA